MSADDHRRLRNLRRGLFALLYKGEPEVSPTDEELLGRVRALEAERGRLDAGWKEANGTAYELRMQIREFTEKFP